MSVNVKSAELTGRVVFREEAQSGLEVTVFRVSDARGGFKLEGIRLRHPAIQRAKQPSAADIPAFDETHFRYNRSDAELIREAIALFDDRASYIT